MARKKNREVAETDMSLANYDLIEFDKYVQTPNDAYAVRLRLSILIKFMREVVGIDLQKAHKYIIQPS